MSAPTPILSDVDAEALRLLEEIERRGIDARLIGGMAIRLLAGEHLPPAYHREVQDLDFVTTRRGRRDLGAFLAEAGYAGDEQFNALNPRRMLFHDLGHGRQIDVFVESFEMCHELPLAERLATLPRTLPAAEVLMTKLQIVELNAKDQGDLFALLHSQELAGHDDGAINVGRITSLTANDWGLQHTFEINLRRLAAALPAQPLGEQDGKRIRGRIDELLTAIDAAPKTRKWKLRARVGERKRWYAEPEEI